ncbi:asparagine synthase (glutamine-hydrolyzing) [Patescibacteria group bacterium]|nr:MAG: asparagine synthase (glutamine-hydrolyzing) [Patescibacteria group bacterium]
MCGIAGYFGVGDRTIVKNMIGAIAYRGPDGEGIFADHRAGLGHRRLAIIDLEPAANQPMTNEDGSIVLIYNGEIYNFAELRRRLAGRHAFRSRSDTEVIVHLYEEAGKNAFEQLNGMFAIALYDSRQGRIFLARDRLGKKPLYWGRFGETLIFGSEIKALLGHPLCKKELNLRALNKYLQYEYVPTPHSIFRDIHKLEPGQVLTYNGREIATHRFWDARYTHNLPTPSSEEAVRELDRRLRETVKTRLVSDVPLGVFLSGGLDSSTIAYYAQAQSPEPIQTFSIGFADRSFDESPFARRAAAFLGTEHHEKIFRPADLLQIIPKISELLDEPLADPSLLPTFLLSQFARQRVTVALGGDGGDELFFGYDTFIGHRLAAFYQKLPHWLKKNLIEKIATGLPTSFANISLDFKIKQFLKGCPGDQKYLSQRWLGAFDDSERLQLFAPEVSAELQKENVFEDIDAYLARVADEKHYDQLAYLYLKTYLLDDILVKVDRASMYNSLEVRAPFLDYTVVDYVNSLPLAYKLRGLERKVILKKLMKGKLPAEIISRQKKGFGLPLASWLTKELKEYSLDLLAESRIRRQGLFSYSYIQSLLSEHFARKKDNRKLIWNLLVFESWYEHYGR